MADATFEETTKVLQDDALGKKGKFKTREEGPVKRVELLSDSDFDVYTTYAHMFKLYGKYDTAVYRRGDSFELTIRFKKKFKLLDNHFKLNFATGVNPSEDNKRKVQLDVKNSSKLIGDKWSVFVEQIYGKEMLLRVNIPPTCPIGLWRMSIVTQPGDETFDTSHFYVIFNPWCKDDAVYMESDTLKNEYVLQETGRIYGAYKDNETQEVKVYPREWGYYQFSPCVLPAAVYFLEGLENIGKKIDRGNPVSVARFLTVKHTDMAPFTEGAWNTFEDVPPNTKPWEWSSSQEILKKYMETLKSVKFSQSWVFAGVACAVCRALGIPCRPVTNYNSAADRSLNLSVDELFEKKDGKNVYVKGCSSDGIWNFHVWNDVWMTRPDLPDGYGGWQIIDTCHRERSPDGEGYFCGPMSLAALKKGEVDKLHDAMYFFCAVDADRNLWIEKDDKFVLDEIQTKHIGSKLLTKAVGADKEEDVISSYKFKEGEDDERKALKNAAQIKKITLHEKGTVRPKTDTMAAQQSISTKPATKKDVHFEFVPLKNVMIGEPVVIRGILENKSKQKRTVYVAMGANSIEYTGTIEHELDLSGKGNSDVKNMFTKTIELLPGQREINAVSIQLKQEDYLDFLVGLGYIEIYASVFVKETNDVLIARDNVIIVKPTLTIEGRKLFTVDMPITLKLKFNNPLNRELKNCSFKVSTNCTLKSESVNFRNVKPKENVSQEVKIMPTFIGSCSFIGRFDSDVLMDVMGIMKADSVLYIS